MQDNSILLKMNFIFYSPVLDSELVTEHFAEIVDYHPEQKSYNTQNIFKDTVNRNFHTIFFFMISAISLPLCSFKFTIIPQIVLQSSLKKFNYSQQFVFDLQSS